VPLDSSVVQQLATLDRLGALIDETFSVEEARAVADAPAPAPTIKMHQVADHQVSVEGGAITVRTYQPTDATDLPLLVWYHGGGWVVGTLDSYDAVCRSMAAMGNFAVASVGYRRAPEHKFPVAIDDAWAATLWAIDNATGFGADGSRIAVAGDSAGGNIAAVIAMMARDQTEADSAAPNIIYQALIYPVVDDGTGDRPSWKVHAEGPFLTTDLMGWFYDHYLNNGDSADWRATPIKGRLDGLPPAFVLTAEYDPLRDEGEEYAELLAAAGVATEVTRYDGMIHAFFRMEAEIPAALDAQAEVASKIRAAFGHA